MEQTPKTNNFREIGKVQRRKQIVFQQLIRLYYIYIRYILFQAHGEKQMRKFFYLLKFNAAKLKYIIVITVERLQICFQSTPKQGGIPVLEKIHTNTNTDIHKHTHTQTHTNIDTHRHTDRAT